MANASLQSAGTASGAFFDDAGHRPSLALEEAAAALDLEPWIVNRLRHPIDESTFYLQLLLDSGNAVCMPLLRVQHRLTFPSTIGGFVMQPGFDLQSCEALAMERSWQAALLELPFGGASYGVVVEPDRLSERELTRLLTLCARRLNKTSSDSWLLPGRGCCKQVMGKLFAGLRSGRNWKVAGKPACLGGLDMDLFAAEGIDVAVSMTLRQSGQTVEGAKVVVQGFASLGQAVCGRLMQSGFRVVGISDPSTGLYRSDGLIVDDVQRHHDREHMLLGYAEANAISRADLLRSEADVLVLTSGANEVHNRNCSQISARVVVEADWSGISAAAKAILFAKHVTVVPWMLATSGALIGGYFEGRGQQVLGNSEKLLITARDIIESIIIKIVTRTASGHTWEHAAQQFALERVAAQMRMCRGVD
jgi:glutamate dehydrogenase/leucine dehydrogenase